ncbi:hypothetical protein CLV30_106143 [Haloactinopolyspora alba]|uniref:Tail protein n=1 Tax=Haloactinopolyspora alba TaxID=648780 RepID=A0A2P8E3T4_9ACTN|nr:hypothetical protein [Haloactinopolyspora alba]PSL04138.1 hypothetical protein CLV30_106143 [Haloactinopolyspora alba]
MDTTYKLGATPLDDPGLRWFLERDNPYQSIPAVRSAAISVPGRDGLIAQHNEHYQSGTLALRLIVTDNDQHGTTRGFGQLEDNLQYILGLAGRRTDLQTIHRVRGDKQHFTRARVVTSIQPEFLDPRNVRVILVFELPDPLWREERWTTATSPSLSSGETWSTSSPTLGGGNAPIRDAIIYADGSMTQLRVTDQTSGQWIELNATSGPGQGLRIDVLDMRAIRYEGNPLDPDTSVDVTGNLDAGPGGFSLVPHYTHTQTQSVVSMDVYRFGGTGTVKIRARRAWLL